MTSILATHTRPSRRDPALREFLRDMLVTAVENGGYGWFEVDDYDPDAPNPYADIIEVEDEDEEGISHHVTLDTIAAGIRVIKHAVLRPYPPGKESVPFNAEKDQRLFLAQDRRRAILAGYYNRDAGDLDVVDALAVLEIALFGEVKYA